MAECVCDVNAYSLQGTCECEEECQCECEVCECEQINLWSVDVIEACPCGDGNCSCGQTSNEA